MRLFLIAILLVLAILTIGDIVGTTVAKMVYTDINSLTRR